MESGLTIPRLKTLLEAYAARRRRELEQLWLVIRHAYGADENTPQSILPPLAEPGTADTAPDDPDDADAFDPVAMVRRHSAQKEGR